MLSRDTVQPIIQGDIYRSQKLEPGYLWGPLFSLVLFNLNGARGGRATAGEPGLGIEAGNQKQGWGHRYEQTADTQDVTGSRSDWVGTHGLEGRL